MKLANDLPQKKEIEPLKIEPDKEKYPEVKPEPDKNKPERPEPGVKPIVHPPEIKPFKEI